MLQADLGDEGVVGVAAEVRLDCSAERVRPETANDRGWHAFVRRASPLQLQMFGFPPPGHRYWTPETLSGLSSRYPGLDLTLWHQ